MPFSPNMLLIVLPDLHQGCLFSLLVHFPDEIIAKIKGSLLQAHVLDSVKEHGLGLGDIPSVDVIGIGLPVHSSQSDVLATAFGNLSSNHFFIELNESKHIHKACSPGIVASEADIAV